VRAVAQHVLPLIDLAPVERRGVEVDDELGAAVGHLLHGTGGRPGVLAHRDAHAHAGHHEQRERFGARREVALLVEDGVVGQAALAIRAHHPAVVDDGGGVEQAGHDPGQHRFGTAVDEADDGHGGLPGGDRRRPVQRPEVVLHEGGLEQQILGWVAGDGQFREDDEITTGVHGLGVGGDDAFEVAVEVSHHGVDLGGGQAHTGHAASLGPPVRGTRGRPRQRPSRNRVVARRAAAEPTGNAPRPAPPDGRSGPGITSRQGRQRR
jgi:hypothetical protein